MSVFAIVCLLLTAAPVKLPRGDETSKDKTFAAFKKDLEAAVKKKDGAFVRGILDPKAQAGFGSSESAKEFEKELPFTEGSALWPTLEAVLSKGCARSGREFVCPWLAGKAPEDVDWFTHSVLGKDVMLRATAADEGKVVATRSDEIVKGVATSERWVKIETAGGVTGHVLATQLDSPVATRAFFKKSAKGWKLTFLGAGD